MAPVKFLKVDVFCCITLLTLTCLVSALYEDQVGKFDWRFENIGQVQHAVFDTSKKSKQIMVASKENVVASISITAGSIAWRHVLEDATLLLDVIELSSNVLTISTNHIRKWNTLGGHQLWQISLQHSTKRGQYIVSGDVIVVLAPTKVIAYNLKTGLEVWSVDTPYTGFEEAYLSANKDTVYIITLNSQKLTVYVLKDEIIRERASLAVPSVKYSCSGSAGTWLVCYDGERKIIEYTDVSKIDANSSLQVIEHTFETLHSPTVRVVGEKGLIVQTENSGAYFQLSEKAAQLLKFDGIAAVTSNADGEDILMSLNSDLNGDHGASLLTAVHSLTNGLEIESYRSSVTTTLTAKPLKMVPYIYQKTGGAKSYRVLIMFSDHTLALIQQSGRVLWTREEALASISCLQMIDLPVSDVQAQMEEEFGSHSGNNLIGQFVGRLVTQLQQLISFAVHSYHKYVVGLRVVMETANHMVMDEDYLTRDEFGLHKIVIAVSNVGKIYGLDSYTGQVVWSHYVPQLQPFNASNRFLMYIQRSTAHFPHDPYATVIGECNYVGCGALIYSFNPITGEAYTQPLQLPYKVDQAMLLPTMQQDFIKPIVLVDIMKEVHVYPPDCNLEGKQELFVFSAQAASGDIVGLRVHGPSVQSLVAEPTWTVSLGSQIVGLRSKEHREQVHSQGKVQADRAVLYKYVNPNLVAIISESEPDTDHVSLCVRLLDGVTGRILFTSEHKRASGPVHMVHSENWLVYTYYNMKARRMEISVLELYEGLSQSNATAFSSLENNISPIVMRQAYILGTSLTALSTTLTERGITGKNILMARTVGGIVEIPKAFLDPRRPLEPTPASKEEGLPPYMPELPLSYEGTINYNQTVFRIRDIHCEPSGLESTSLVIAYGLDVFHTRIAPSKMYDVLKDDFDYLFIGAVTIGMIVISFVSRYFALRKKVKRAWK